MKIMAAIEGIVEVKCVLKYCTGYAREWDLGEHVELVPVFPEITESLCVRFLIASSR